MLPRLLPRITARRSLAATLFVAALLAPAWAPAASRYPARARNGMVASAHPAATAAGVEAMRRGGNAVDAAVATALVAGVVEPYSAGIGGGGFMLVRDGRSGAIAVIDYRETAPAAASRDMYLDAAGEVIASASDVGHRAVAVPGTVAGLHEAHRRFGRLKWKAVVAPAIRAAEKGFAVDEKYRALATQELARLRSNPEAARIFLAPAGGVPELGAVIRQPDLARTLRRIAAKGPTGFQEGPVAAAIAADMARSGGLVTLADLQNYRPRTTTPITSSFREYEIVTMPPPSSGGVHLAQMLNVIEHDPIQEWGWNSSRTIHLLAETMRRAYADRAEFLGDPAFVRVPVAGLTSDAYAQSLRRGIDAARASSSSTIRHGDPLPFESDHTTHLCTIDRDGYAVSLTQTINYTFGSGVVAPGTGVLLNNEMDDFSAKPGVPNLYGLVGGEANAIAPGKIPLSSMTPTIVLRDGRPVLVVGSPGGARIITTVLNVVLNNLVFGMDPQEAVDAPRIHHQWLPDELRVEPRGISADTRAALEALGHRVSEQPEFGNAMAIGVDGASGEFLGAADSRGVGSAAGF